jgi:hypothetical protein
MTKLTATRIDRCLAIDRCGRWLRSTEHGFLAQLDSRLCENEAFISAPIIPDSA